MDSFLDNIIQDPGCPPGMIYMMPLEVVVLYLIMKLWWGMV